MGEDRPYAGSYSGGNAGYLRMADHYCVHAEGDLVHFVPDSAVRCDMIDYEEVVEAIWRYDCPRIDIDEDITTLYADGKPFAQVIHRADGSREDLYFEDYELQKDILIKPNATLRDVVELCMNGDISYADAREWCMENDISLGQFDRWLYGALRKSDNPARVKSRAHAQSKSLPRQLKIWKKIQLLLLKVALAFVKIDKESMVNENAAKNV